MKIALKDIITTPWNTRGEIAPESVKELAQSIKEQGLINPLTVWMDGDGNGWYCIAGNRRLAALLSIGADEAECTEFKGDEAEAKLVTITENLQREDVGILEEANGVCALLDAGKTVADVAARLGRSTNWVARRRKLSALTDAWKARAAKTDADALERIACYPPKVQDKMAKRVGETASKWSDMHYCFTNEMKSLDEARFDTKPCRACEKRTGVQADLFGECDGGLGRCLDCACFEKNRKAHEDAEIAKATAGADEVVRLEFAWQFTELDGKPKRDKKHPCAYVHVDYDGEVRVKFGESQKALKERREAEQAAKDAENQERRMAREASDKITDKLSSWSNGLIEDGTPLREFLAPMFAADAPEKAKAYILEVMVEHLDGWKSNGDWADILRAFDGLTKLVGITEEEFDHLDAEYPEETDEGEED